MRDRGVAAVEYSAALVLAAALVGTMFATGLAERFAAGCRTAVCQIFGGDCGEAAAQPARRAFAPPSGAPTPPPCRTTPESQEWTEGLLSHNDYQNEHALRDALDHGATAVEVDLAFDDEGNLIVTHDGEPVKQDDGTTVNLLSDYVSPLVERAAANGNQVYKGRKEPFNLVIELKTVKVAEDASEDEKREAARTNQQMFDRALGQVSDLERYGINVVFATVPPSGGGGKLPAGVSFIASGTGDCTLPASIVPGTRDYDPAYARNVSLVNASWTACALDHEGRPRGQAKTQELMNQLVRDAHGRGLKVRFVEGPDGMDRDPERNGEFDHCPELSKGESKGKPEDCGDEARRAWWRMQMNAGVDLLDTQHLSRGFDWLRTCGASDDVPNPRNRI